VQSTAFTDDLALLLLGKRGHRQETTEDSSHQCA